MYKTIYIDVDEEITSTIGKIRKEGAPDIFLVVPKDAMLLQGVINLKLLKKEADKLKKELILITPNKHAKKIIEDLGMEVRDGLAKQQSANIQTDVNLRNKDNNIKDEISDKAIQESLEEIRKTPNAGAIGTTNFYAEARNEIPEVKSEVENNFVAKNLQSETVPIQKQQKSYEAEKMKRHLFVKKEKEALPQAQTYSYKESPQPAPVRLPQEDYVYRKSPMMAAESYPKGKNNTKAIFKKKEAEDFFSSQKKSEGGPNQNKKTKTNKRNFFNKKIFIIFFILIGSAGLVWWVYLNWPRTVITIYPKSEEISEIGDLKVVTKQGDELGENEISGRIQEIEIEEISSFKPSSEKFSSDKGKARGKVIIYNKFSSSQQPLIATTRFLSKEGKLFRLSKDVIVPGMKNDQPGEIEVSVMADQPGEDSNIESSTFTIEGFKGNPKYEKFEVASKEAMTGGENSTDNKKVKVATQQDIENARAETLEALDKSIENKIDEKNGEGESYAVNSVEREIIKSSSSCEVNEIVKDCKFIIQEKIKLMVFHENDIKSFAIRSLESKKESGYELEEDSVTTEYLKTVMDFKNKELKLKVEAIGTTWPQIDEGNIKKGIAYKQEEKMTNFLTNYTEIKKAEIEISPVWLTFIPISEKKISIKEVRQH